MADTIPLPSPQLAGDGFVLRPFAAGDYDAANDVREDEDAVLWVNALPQPDGEAMSRFDEESRRNGKLLHLAIEADDGSAYLGEIVLFQRAAEAAEAGIGEIAYVVAPAARGRGIATGAVRLLSEWAFAELGLERLQLSIHPANMASRRVAEKAGYQYEGTLRSTKVIRGNRVDSMMFSLLPGDP
jgi:RimJ/RimL family protein N-acetyltransferase